MSTPFTSGTPLVSTPDSIITKYGNKVIIPKMLPKIEEALKREVSTPHEIRSRDKKAVEDALKREISLFLQFLK